MVDLVVRGGKRLNGELPVQGAKNSILPILAATVLCEGTCELCRCPMLSDVENSLDILRELGCRCRMQDHCISVDASALTGCSISEKLMCGMRSSIVFLGAVLGRIGRAVISSPGGCELGPRPIDLHLSALREMGAEIVEDHGFLYCSTPSGLQGCEIDLAFPSVGATENIMLAGALAKGKTVIHNAAREPEICDLAQFLNAMGGKVSGYGTDTVTVEGVQCLKGTRFCIMPDRIAAATYLCMAAITGGKILLREVCPAHLIPVLSVLKQAGCTLELGESTIRLSAPAELNAVPTIRTQVYPGFPTDAGPMMIALLSKANGTTVFVENIFENRYRYVDELNRLGAQIKVEGRVAVVRGVSHLSGAGCSCTDLRGGAALLVAGLAAEGETCVTHTEHLMRGYECLQENLAVLGADIKYQ
ncbi:MAG: UDP-N-acetylglucosamine 1-carboxyvinyltransferase [Clostridia bacterium]|nr:UDP-N-acetylglucosamine 1-carboxyvinyltransferase [Clostridia bacterium]